MNPAIEAILDEYDERSRREWSGVADPAAPALAEGRDRMLLSVGRAAGQFLNLLARESKAQRILEIGTSYGYSTLWLAEAAQATGGKVVSLDVAAYKQDYAAAQLERVGLRGAVEFHSGDALKVIPTLEGSFDLVLMDLWKDVYVACLKAVVPKLAPGATVIADNMLQPVQDKPHALDYRRAVRAVPGMSSVLLPIGQGLEVSRLAGPTEEGL